MTNKPQEKRTEIPGLAAQVHLLTMRLIMGGGMCALLAVSTYDKRPSLFLLDIATIIGAITYLIITHLFLRIESNQETKKVSIEQFTTLDAFLVGFSTAYVEHSLFLSLLFSLMIIFSGILLQGVRKALFDVLGLGCGALVAIVLLQDHHIGMPSSFIVTLGGIVLLFAVFLTYAHSLNNSFNKLVASSIKIRKDQAIYRERTHKLARYLTPTVWKAVVEGREDSLKTERKKVTVFFSDIAGFSSLSEDIEPETLTALLNNYLTEMAKIATKHKGTIDKFMGDGIMIMFGDTQSAGQKTDCLRALSMSIEMRRKMKELETYWYNKGIKNPLTIRMGLNTGFCTVGSFGTSHYVDYTVLGKHVNLASRLESMAEPGEILITHETWSLVKDIVMCRDKGDITVKGFKYPVKVYQVADFRKDLGKNQSYFEENTQGFSMHMDLDKIRNYDKDRVVEYLDKVKEKLKDKVITKNR